MSTASSTAANAARPNAPAPDAEPQGAEPRVSRDQTLAYLSRYLFWLVMAVLLAVFSLVI